MLTIKDKIKVTDTLSHLAPMTLQQLGLRESQVAKLQSPWSDMLDATMAWLAAQPDHHLIDCFSADYPALLREVADAPAVFLAKGDVSILDAPQIAIVGSRKPTQQGKETAQQFATALASAGFVITSGMALGIDAAAHRGALSANAKTIAVVGTGLERVYPPQHRQLMSDIYKQGVIVSEFHPSAAANAKHFPQRNRIISGLSLGVLVVEAAQRSGSLSTASHAARQSREVFAVPGSIYNPLSRGCHQLIRQGAKLVEKIQDITEELSHYCLGVDDSCLLLKHPQSPQKGGKSLDKEHLNLLDCVDDSPTSVDKIAKRSGLSANEVMAKLLTLETAGFVSKNRSGFQRV